MATICITLTVTLMLTCKTSQVVTPVTFRGQLKVNSGLEVNVCASIELNSGGGVIPRESRVTCFHWQFISCSIYAESII